MGKRDFTADFGGETDFDMPFGFIEVKFEGQWTHEEGIRTFSNGDPGYPGSDSVEASIIDFDYAQLRDPETVAELKTRGMTEAEAFREIEKKFDKWVQTDIDVHQYMDRD